MYELVESRVRRIVADHLGVGMEELTAEVSLVDTLAADSLDLVELALGLEAEFEITIPERSVESVRTYGELVQTVYALARRRPRAAGPERAATPPALVWAKVVPSEQHAGGDLQRTGWLTPYTAEEIVEDALRAGRGARLELSVPPSTNDVGLARLQNQFAWLGDRGVQVSVRREQNLAIVGARPRPYAAA
jgi:acyl carrier protein